VRLDADAVRLSRDGAVMIDDRSVALRAEVEVRIGGGRLDPTLAQRITIENTGDAPLDARIGSEWAITMLGGGGNPEAWWELEGERTSHDGTGSASNVERLAQGNGWLGAEVSTFIEPAGDAWIAPIETISNSEAGFERVYQGGALLLSWPVRLAPGERWSATITHKATVAHDRAADDEPAIVAMREI
jgi:hypothetical protein